MSTVTYKCPHCGGQVSFDAAANTFVCQSCKSVLSQSDFINETDTASAQDQGSAVVYSCPTCGAQLVTDATTAATECYYCHSNIVLSGRLSDDMKPNLVIPFKISKEKAFDEFKKWIATKKYLPRDFFYEGQIEKLAGVYYPYWLADYKGVASFSGEGRIIRKTTTATHYVTKTDIYRITRTGDATFENVFRPALSKADRKLAEGIFPYRLSGLQDFSMPYLAGFFAEKRDVGDEAVSPEIENELRGYSRSLIVGKTPYTTVSGNSSLQFKLKRYRYLLLPAWIMTYRSADGKINYFAMNGQTGKTCGRLPLAYGKLYAHAALIFAAIAAVLCIGGYLFW